MGFACLPVLLLQCSKEMLAVALLSEKYEIEAILLMESMGCVMDKVLLQFLAVAESGSISGAATTLLVTQPTLTTNLKKLEQSLGVPLFERSSRGVRLTSYGETLYENALIMRRLNNNAIQSIKQQRVRREQGISIATGYSWWTLILRDLVAEYRSEFPAAPINVSLGNSVRCMEQLLSGDVSISIGQRLSSIALEVGADFIFLSMVRDGFFVRSGHALLARPRKLAEIMAYPMTMAFPPEARQQRLLDYEHELGRQQPGYMNYAFTSNSLDACLDYVRASDAVLRHTDMMAAVFGASGVEQVELEPGEVLQPQQLGIHVLSERRSDPRVASLISRVCEKAAEVLPIMPAA